MIQYLISEFNLILGSTTKMGLVETKLGIIPG